MDLTRQEDRLKIIQSLQSENTKARKQWSLRSSETYGGRFDQYVREYLESQFYKESVKEMPIVSSINILKRVTDKKATIYNKPPERMYTELSDDQISTMGLVYKDMKLNSKLGMSNKSYVYQGQSIGMILPKNGKLICRIFKMHQIDVIPDLEDPELANGYIISAFDRSDYVQEYQDNHKINTATGVRPDSLRSSASELYDNELADDYQFKKYVEKYIVWKKHNGEILNFMMNGMGEVINPDTGEPDDEVDVVSPLSQEGILPFFEISKDKDFEYFVRPSNTLTDFTVQFNAALSDLQNNMKMNGYAVGILKAPSELQPETQIIGPAMLMKLPTDDPDKVVDFGFASPSSSIGEISDAVDKFLNYFTTSEGLGSEVINSAGQSEKFASGLDRFIASVARVEAHQDDYERYGEAEDQIFQIILAWQRVLANSDALDRKYKLGLVSEDAALDVKYYQPEMIQTESEMISNFRDKIDLGIMSKVDALMKLTGITDREVAKELLDEIRSENLPFMGTFTPPSEIVDDEMGGEEEEDTEE